MFRKGVKKCRKINKSHYGCGCCCFSRGTRTINTKNSDIVQQITGLFDSTPQASKVADVPEYDGKHQEIEINQNRPDFTEEDLSLAKGTWQSYSNIDRLNRVGAANALLGKDLFPKEKREPLYIDPTGWKQKN